MKCIHHNDDDGLCAAAIVRFYLKDKPEEPSDFIMWRHGALANTRRVRSLGVEAPVGMFIRVHCGASVG